LRKGVLEALPLGRCRLLGCQSRFFLRFGAEPVRLGFPHHLVLAFLPSRQRRTVAAITDCP